VRTARGAVIINRPLAVGGKMKIKACVIFGIILLSMLCLNIAYAQQGLSAKDSVAGRVTNVDSIGIYEPPIGGGYTIKAAVSLSLDGGGTWTRTMLMPKQFLDELRQAKAHNRKVMLVYHREGANYILDDILYPEGGVNPDDQLKHRHGQPSNDPPVIDPNGPND
jgi:hypothetical protein